MLMNPKVRFPKKPVIKLPDKKLPFGLPPRKIKGEVLKPIKGK
jgi:hypothetical protein